MPREKMTLRRVVPDGDIWLVMWGLEKPVWAVVSGRRTASAMMAEVVSHVQEIPWREDAPSRLAVGKAVLAIEEHRA